VRKLFWLVLVTAGMVLAAAGPGASQGPLVLVGKIEGVINPISAQYVDRVLADAEARHAAAVVFRVDTPGGLASSTFRITTRFLNASVPVLTFVAPSGARAASAGTFITMAGHVAAMAPATNIGAAHPVDSSGGNIEGDLRDKVLNDTVAEAQKIAIARGRNAQWAEDAVRKSVSIRDEEAVRIDVVDLVATDVADLLRKSNGRQIQFGTATATIALGEAPAIETADPSLIEGFLHIVVDPQIALLLFTLGTYGLIFELSNPSLIFPGVIGVVAIVLALFAFGTLDANAAGIALIVFAMLLFVAEIWVTSHGILTAGGIASLLLGALLLFPPGNPTLPGLRLTIHPLVLAAVVAVPAGFFGLILRGALDVRRARPVSGVDALIGVTGVAQTDVAPSGVVRVRGEDWSAYVEQGRVAKGERIRVRRIDSVRLVVEPVESDGRGN
jgi:membrane-bound serine protease (ClpP class)